MASGVRWLVNPIPALTASIAVNPTCPMAGTENAVSTCAPDAANPPEKQAAQARRSQNRIKGNTPAL
jgi:hypothetical protein